MNVPYFYNPLFWVGRNYVSLAGLCAFAALLVFGLILARVLQGAFVRRVLSRFRMDKHLVAIVTTITVFAGAVGVGGGFGLQNIASNFISGLVILAERPITIGDRVEVAGVAGQVQQIRARSTVILINDNISMIVPNTKFIDSPVTNWTYGDPRVRFRVPIGVAYGSDVGKVREALIAAAREHPSALNEPAPNAFLDKFGDSSIDLSSSSGALR